MVSFHDLLLVPPNPPSIQSLRRVSFSETLVHTVNDWCLSCGIGHTMAILDWINYHFTLCCGLIVDAFLLATIAAESGHRAMSPSTDLGLITYFKLNNLLQMAFKYATN